jgi:hypothetical protein
MTLVTAETLRTRRYLLGQASDDEATAIEQHFLQNDAAIDWISAAEEGLIEDYLTNQLGAADRDRFERAYLTVPHRRIRVETIRRLMTRGGHSSAGQPQSGTVVAFKPRLRQGQWLALAASLLLATVVVLRMFGPLRSQPAPIAANQPPQPSAGASTPVTPAAPRVFALTLAPLSVRGAAENPAVVIPPDAEVVAIHFEADPDTRGLTARRAVVGTVDGRETWRGAVTDGRIDVPAARLPADDYIVTLFGADRSGAEREWNQYFLRVRAR